jgi:hypothetical protein
MHDYTDTNNLFSHRLNSASGVMTNVQGGRGLGVIFVYLETRFYVTKKPIYAIARQQENGAVSCYLNAFIQSTSILNVPDCLSAIRNQSC